MAKKCGFYSERIGRLHLKHQKLFYLLFCTQILPHERATEPLLYLCHKVTKGEDTRLRD